MIGGKELTRVEHEVVREALDEYITLCDRLQQSTRDQVKREEYGWKRYVAQELRHELNTR